MVKSFTNLPLISVARNANEEQKMCSPCRREYNFLGEGISQDCVNRDTRTNFLHKEPNKERGRVTRFLNRLQIGHH